jgi:hypothetical protein
MPAADGLASQKSGLTQNVAPEEMWTRVRQCVFPAHILATGDSYLAGTVDIGVRISPDGDVIGYRLNDGEPSLSALSVDAMRQWKFRPNVVQNLTTFSRVRALVRFDADGATSVELARALTADDFGDHATTSPQVITIPVPRPPSSPACSSAQPRSATSKPD